MPSSLGWSTGGAVLLPDRRGGPPPPPVYDTVCPRCRGRMYCIHLGLTFSWSQFADVRQDARVVCIFGCLLSHTRSMMIGPLRAKRGADCSAERRLGSCWTHEDA